MQQELPSKYYLAHAQELFSSLKSNSRSLLGDTENELLSKFEGLPENTQCLLVRCLARKPRFLRINTLSYAEIDQLEQAIQHLLEQQILKHPDTQDWQLFIEALNKNELLELLSSRNLSIRASAPKAQLLTLAQQHVDAASAQSKVLAQRFVCLTQQASWDYLFFVFFGNLNNQFQKFVMRDLGILQTRKAKQQVARFTTQQEARLTFKLNTLYQAAKTRPQQIAEQHGEYLIATPSNGHQAQQLKDKLLLNLGNAYQQHDVGEAQRFWRASSLPQAQEKWIRLEYKHGDQQALLEQLNAQLSEQIAPQSRIFIEDFISRKYHGKRTSIYTDMLRETSLVWQLDEAFLNSVEHGVVNLHRQNGHQAYFSENEFWRVLFALSFWELLFEQNQYTEFDRLPLGLRSGRFYTDNQDAIERALKEFSNGKKLLFKFIQLSSKYYGKANGLFRWRRSLMDLIKTALLSEQCAQLAEVMREMARNYQHSKDGYPDLMICENNQLWFEEVKAPGDSLRPNQLLAIQSLRKAGLRVDISQVEWSTNPDQSYAVVDIETTGGMRGGNAITEIAVVTIRNHQVVREWSSLINPRRHIPRHITQLTGIDNAMVAQAPTFAEIADDLAQELEDSIFVAHNVGFDYGFIKAAYEALGRSLRMPKYCTVRNTRKAFPGLKSYSLGALCNHFDIDLQGHHRALNDARATADLLLLIQEQNRANNMFEQASASLKKQA